MILADYYYPDPYPDQFHETDPDPGGLNETGPI